MGSSTNGIAPKLYQRAWEALAGEIDSGAMKPGARLTESAVASRFGISRAPARQALAELERRGLIRKMPARGYTVVGLGAIMTLDERRAVEAPAPDANAKLQFQPSWQLLYPAIEIEIVSRTSLASWRINEAILAKHHGVSRTVARDVVARLQQRGIVHKDDKGRWQAPALTERHIDQLYELRWVLEPLALEKAFSNLPEGLLDRLAGHVEAAIAHYDAVDSKVLDALEQELHVELLGYCGNDALMRAISLPQALLVAHHFLYRWTTELFDTEPFLPEHLAIIDCLRRADVTSAKEAMVRHLQISRQRATQRIKAVAQLIAPDELPYLERLEDGS